MEWLKGGAKSGLQNQLARRPILKPFVFVEIGDFLTSVIKDYKLRDVSLFSGGEGEGHNFFPLVGEGHNFFQGFLGEGHNFLKYFY